MTQAKAEKLRDLLRRIDQMQARDKETTWVVGADGISVRLSDPRVKDVIQGRIAKELES